MTRTILTLADRTIDLTPIAARRNLLEDSIRRAGVDGAAQALADLNIRGEPILCGQDPVSNFLNGGAPHPTVAHVREDAVYIFYLKPDSDRRLPLVRWPLDEFPGIVGFLYCVQGLRYPDLSPPHLRVTHGDDDH